MLLGAPPAAAGAFEEDRDVRPEIGLERASLQPFEELVVDRNGDLAQRDLGAFVLGDADRLALRPVAKAGLGADFAPGKHVLDELDEYPFAFAAHDYVNPWKAFVQRRAHRAIAVSAAENDAQRRIPFLENLRQNERRNVLLKHARETHDPR